MADSTAAPLSLRDRIKQLEQAAQSPLVAPSPGTSLRPTSTGVTPSPSSTRLSIQPVSDRDDLLQNYRAKEPYAATRSVEAAAKTAREGTASVPPPKPPRPVWVSKAKGDTAAPFDTAVVAADDRRASAANTTLHHANDELRPALPPDSTSTLSPDTVGLSRPLDPTTQVARVASTKSSSSAPKPDLPSRPPKPPSLTVASPDSSSARPTLHASSPSPISSSPTSMTASAKPAPGLPPRPAWARKQSPSPAPVTDGTSSFNKPGAAVGTPPPPRSSTTPLRRNTTSTVNSGSSTSSSLSLPGPQGPPSRNSASPALPPRTRWTPLSDKPATEALSPVRPTENPSRGGSDTDADEAAAAARKRYDRLFERCLEVVEEQYGPTGGRLDGVMVVELWRRSRLDDARLRKIWNDVSTPESRQQGGLERDEFARGMAAIDAELRKRWSR